MTTLISDHELIGRGLWIRWVSVLIVFMVGSVIATDFLARPVLTQAISNLVVREALIVLGLAVLGAAIGTSHWLILRPYLARAARWGAAIAVTLWLGGSLIEIAFAAGTGQLLSVVAGYLLLGPVCGILQYRVLRRQVKCAGWWVLAWTLNWPILFAVAVAASYVAKLGFNIDVDSGLALDYGVGGAVSGALTGCVLVWLLRQPAIKSFPAPEAPPHTLTGRHRCV